MRTLIILGYLLLSFVGFSLSAADTYTVNTQSKLNMRSGPGKSYSIVTQVTPGSDVVMLEENEGQWVKVEYRGVQGYVMKSYLTLKSGSPTDKTMKKLKIGDDPQNRWLLWIIVVLFVIMFLNNTLEMSDNPFFIGALYLTLPATIILYCVVTPQAMWFCDPDVVGWLLTIINVFLLIFAIMICWSTMIGAFSHMFNNFSFMLLLIGLLFIGALLFMVITAIKELLIVGLIMLLGAGGGSTKLGTFIDNDGNVYDIFQRY